MHACEASAHKLIDKFNMFPSNIETVAVKWEQLIIGPLGGLWIPGTNVTLFMNLLKVKT